MRKIAGTLRLELAQFRELEAFAQFGSDLDEATLFQLNRGARLVEVLKQPQYEPLPIERQILVVYVATNGHLDEVPIHQIARYEQELFRYISADHSEIFERLRESMDLDDALSEKIDAAVTAFTEKFQELI